MATIASKVLADLRKPSRGEVVDLSAYREARAAAVDDDELDEEVDGQPVSFWMDMFKMLYKAGFSLLDSRHLTRLNERLIASEDEYMPGGPPMSPLTDSFHSTWSLLDTAIGLKKETLATVTIAVGRAMGAPRELLAAWQVLADSYAGVYRIAARSGDRVSLVELVTGAAREVVTIDRYPGQVGQLWWIRLLPPEPGIQEHWTSIVTPYLFVEPDAEAMWLDYFARQLKGVPENKRAEAYRRHMVQGSSPTSWFDYIEDAYVGLIDSAIVLRGVADRPETLPHSEAWEGDSLSADQSPLDRLRRKLMNLSVEFGFFEAATDEFCDVRETLCKIPPSQPEDWLDVERNLLCAYSMYERVLDEEDSALETAAKVADTLDEDEALALRALQEGWFSLFEVLRIKIDEAIEVRDVLRRRRFWIQERSGTQHLVIGDCLGIWVMKEGDEYRIEGVLGHVPQAWAEMTISTMQEIMEKLRQDRSMSWRERQGRLVPWLSAMVARMGRSAAPVELVNRHGEPVLLTEAHYAVADTEKVLAALRAEKVLSEEEPGSFVWTEDGGDSLVGCIEVAGESLTIKGDSEARVELVRNFIEGKLGELIRFKLKSHVDPLSAAQDREPGPVVDPADLPPEALAAVHETMKRHFTRWLDEPIPALGNKTPRQAVRSAKGRDNVTTLLVQQERGFAGDPLAGGLDLSFLWTELGLRRPG